MEPLGAAASVITLLELLHKITIICLNVHSRINNATPDLNRLINEVKSLRGILERLVDLSTDESIKDGTRLRHLETLAKPGGILAECSSELEDLEKWLQKALRSSTSSLVGQIQWTLKEKDVSRRLEGITRVKSTLLLGLAADHTQLLLESKSATLSLTKTVKESHAKHYRRTVIDWLASLSSHANTSARLKDSARSTGHWFLHGTTFEEWKSSPHSLLWLHGIPGSGKTVLCSLVHQTLRETMSNINKPLVLQFFFDFAAHERQNTSALVCSLMLQIAETEEEVPSAITSLYDSWSNRSQNPSEMELLETLRISLSSERQTFIILDGLDECEIRKEILDNLGLMSNWKLPQLHLMIASRHEPDIERALVPISSHICHMDVEDVNGDIGKYVQQSINEDPRLKRWPIDVQNEIAHVIGSKAGGMFRWADCQLQEVKQCKTLKKLRIALGSLPSTLEDTYARILDSIDPSYSSEAHQMLMWLCDAVRPLHVAEMTEALAVDLEDMEYDETRRIEDPEDIATLCGSLVIFQLGILKLAHYSVKEYLTSERLLSSPQSAYYVSSKGAHLCITRTCLLYLRHYDQMQRVALQSHKSTLTQSLPLYAYSISVWSHHFILSDKPTELMTLASDVLGDPSSIFASKSWHIPSLELQRLGWSWTNLIKRFSTIPDWAQIERANIYATYGLPKGNQALLHHAATSGCTKLLQIVLERPDIEVNSYFRHYGPPLYEAVFEGSRPSVQLLLDHGADVNISRKDGSTALHAAVIYSSNASEMITMLLNAGAKVENLAGPRNLLEWAAKCGQEEKLRLLLEAGMDPNADEGIALQGALSRGRINCARILLRAGADRTLRGGAYGYPLVAATCGGIESLKLFLMGHNGQETYCDSEGRTALHLAASLLNLPMIEYLLDLGLDVNHEDARGWSAIHYAAMWDTVDCLEALLATAESTPFSQKENTWSPLHVACQRNRPKALDMLLRAGFKPTTVKTFTPDRDWNLYDIAYAYRNDNLVDQDGNPKHEILWECKNQSDRTTNRPQFPLASNWICDGCSVGNNQCEERSFGLRFRCTICLDFDYCLMCATFADRTHAHPLMPMFEIGFTSDTATQYLNIRPGSRTIDEHTTAIDIK